MEQLEIVHYIRVNNIINWIQLIHTLDYRGCTQANWASWPSTSRKSMEAGVKPDIRRFAREAYVSMARMSGAIGNLESIGARANAQQVAQMMKRHRAHQLRHRHAARPDLAGRARLLKVVDQIAQAPQKYMQFVDPPQAGHAEGRAVGLRACSPQPV